MSILDGIAGTDDSSTPTASTLSNDDYQNILRTVAGEAGNQGPAGWAAVANVIKNRLNSGTYGNSASAVVQAPKQFSVWNDGTPALPDDQTSAKMMPIIKSVFEGNAPDPTNGATNYYANKGPNAITPPSWAQGVSNPIQIGDQVFMKVPGGSSGTPTQVASNSPTTPIPTQPQAQPATDATGGSGAFNANFLTNGIGTLFGMSPQQSHDLGNRIDRASAALASISNPGQASVLASLQQKPQAALWSDVGAAPNKKGRIQQNSQTGQIRYQPYPGAADDTDSPDLKTGDFTNLAKYTNTAESNRSLANDAYDAMHQLASDPKIYEAINGASNFKQLWNNLQGKGDDLSDFGKLAKSLIARSVEASAGPLGTASRSVYMQKLEKEAMAPNGADMDPKLLYGVLQRIAQQAQQNYSGAIQPLISMKKKFGDNMAFTLDPKGSVSDYDSSVRQNWNLAKSAADKAYNTGLGPWHQARVSGGSSPASSTGGTSRVQAIQQMYSGVKTVPGAITVPQAPAPQPTTPQPITPQPLGVFPVPGSYTPYRPGMPAPQT